MESFAQEAKEKKEREERRSRSRSRSRRRRALQVEGQVLRDTDGAGAPSTEDECKQMAEGIGAVFAGVTVRQDSDLGVHRACPCLVWVKYIDLISLAGATARQASDWGGGAPCLPMCHMG